MDLNISACERAQLIKEFEDRLPHLTNKSLEHFFSLILALLYDHQVLESLAISRLKELQDIGHQLKKMGSECRQVAEILNAAKQASISHNSTPLV